MKPASFGAVARAWAGYCRVEAWRSITSRAPALSITLRHHEVEDVARRVRAVAELRRRELAGGAR